MIELRIISFKCRGWKDSKKRFDVMNYLKNLKADIYVPHDVHWNAQMEKIYIQNGVGIASLVLGQLIWGVLPSNSKINYKLQ